MSYKQNFADAVEGNFYRSSRGEEIIKIVRFGSVGAEIDIFSPEGKFLRKGVRHNTDLCEDYQRVEDFVPIYPQDSPEEHRVRLIPDDPNSEAEIIPGYTSVPSPKTPEDILFAKEEVDQTPKKESSSRREPVTVIREATLDPVTGRDERLEYPRRR